MTENFTITQDGRAIAIAWGAEEAARIVALLNAGYSPSRFGLTPEEATIAKSKPAPESPRPACGCYVSYRYNSDRVSVSERTAHFCITHGAERVERLIETADNVCVTTGARRYVAIGALRAALEAINGK